MTNQAANGKKKNGGYAIANDRANDRQPHFRGKVTVEGKEWWLSMWEQEPRDGKAMYSIELTDPATLPPRPNAGNRAGAPAAQGQGGSRAPSPSSAPAPRPPAKGNEGGNQAFDDIFGGGDQQW